MRLTRARPVSVIPAGAGADHRAIRFAREGNPDPETGFDCCPARARVPSEGATFARRAGQSCLYSSSTRGTPR